MKKGVYIILKGCYKDFFYIIGRFVFVCSIYIIWGMDVEYFKIFFNGFDLYYWEDMWLIFFLVVEFYKF